MNIAKWLDHSADANAIVLVLNDSVASFMNSIRPWSKQITTISLCCLT